MTPTESTSAPITKTLDMTGFSCPIPVIKMEAALRQMSAGQVLEIIADDPVAIIDIPHFCAEGDFSVIRTPNRGDACVFLVTAHGKTMD